MKRLLSSFLLCCFFLNLYSINIDSLLGIWKDTTLKFSVRSNAITDIISKGYLYSQTDSALLYANSYYETTSSIGDSIQLANALNLIGLVYNMKGENIKSIDYLMKSLNISFNSRYLTDIASQIENDSIIINLKDPGSPVLIRDILDKNSFHVVMPMKI